MNSLKTPHLRPQLSAEQTDVMEENGSQENNREHADTVRVEGGEVWRLRRKRRAGVQGKSKAAWDWSEEFFLVDVLVSVLKWDIERD